MNVHTLNRNAILNDALVFATMAHGDQVRKGNEHIPYIAHPMDVMNEVIYYSGLSVRELETARIIALLHDTVEATTVTIADVHEQFGDEVADGVAALSKDASIKNTNELSKIEQLKENLVRLRAAPRLVQCVKLADRVSNLKSFPAMWSREKIVNYLDEAKLIADELGSASEGLQARLLGRIAEARTILSITT